MSAGSVFVSVVIKAMCVRGGNFFRLSTSQEDSGQGEIRIETILVVRSSPCVLHHITIECEGVVERRAITPNASLLFGAFL